MKDLNKSLALLDSFFENTSREDIHRMTEKVNAMFTSDISFIEYFSLMNSAYDFPVHAFSSVEYKTAEFFRNTESKKCIIGADVSPVQLKTGASYSGECYYNFAA